MTYQQINYDNFFEEFKNLALKLQLTDPENLIGANEEEIYQFEHKNNVKYPLAMCSYLKFFGKKAFIKNTDFYFNMSFCILEEALNKAINYLPGKSAWQWLDEQNFRIDHMYITDSYPPNQKDEDFILLKDLMKIQDITFYRWDSDTQTLAFFDYTKENPALYYIMEMNWVNSNNGRFTDLFRSILYLIISSIAREERLWINDFNGIEWLKEYIYIYKNSKVRMTDYRNDFKRLNLEREKRENKLLGIVEYETEFLNYVHQQE